MERPEELVAVEDIHARCCGDGFEAARRPEAEAGASQEAGEVDDVLGEGGGHDRPCRRKPASPGPSPPNPLSHTHSHPPGRGGNRKRKNSSFNLEVPDDVLDDIMELYIEFHRIISMDPRDQIGTLTEVGSILLAPFDPLQVSITRLHEVPPLPGGCECVWERGPGGEGHSPSSISPTRPPSIFSMSS